MIALIDYGAGNLTSVRKALAAIGAGVETPRTPDALVHAQGIIVPGVGHFGATRALQSEWRDVIRARIDMGVPLLGICLGMQWLFDGSDEASDVAGLGAIRGVCYRLGTAGGGATLKVPHVGWNSLEPLPSSRLMANVPDEAQVYFTHSYAAPVVQATAAITTYGTSFSAAVEHGHIAGVQFHPEKSGEVGLRILANWLRSFVNASVQSPMPRASA